MIPCTSEFSSSKTEEMIFKWQIFSTPSSLSFLKVLEKTNSVKYKNFVFYNMP